MIAALLVTGWFLVALLLAVLVGLVIGGAARAADRRELDLLADQPVECLSQDEIDRRIKRLDVWL